MPDKDTNKEKTVGDLLSDVIDKNMERMNDVFTNLFIYGPELFKIPVRNLEEKINKEKNESSN